MKPAARIVVGVTLLASGGCDGPRAPADGLRASAADAGSPSSGLVIVSAGLEADPAIRACLGDPSGYDRREEMEPHAAVDPADPDHLVAAWMTRVEGERGAILAAASRDGGRTWGRPSALPFNTCAGGEPGLPQNSDPWVAIGPSGRVYVTGIAWKPGEGLDSASVVVVVTSADGGDTWSSPVAASRSRALEFAHDNTAVITHPSTGATWITTTRMSATGRPAAVTRSTDGGETWSTLGVAMPADRAASAPQPVVTRESVHIFYGHGADGSRVSSVRSDDGGVTWTGPMLVHDGEPLDGEVMFPGSDVEIAVAPDIMHPAADPETGDLYLTFSTADPGHATRLAVWLTGSRDNGSTWSTPVRVGESGMATWRPTLAAAPGGPAVVTYFRQGKTGVADDRSRPPLTVSDMTTEVGLDAFGWDDTGALRRRWTRTLDRFIWLPRYTGSYFLGDYHGLVATENAAIAVFARSTADGSRIVAVREGLP